VMRPRYRPSRDLTARQRGRVMRALACPVLIRAYLPAFAVWWGFILAGLSATRAMRPEVDINGWRFIAAFLPVSCVVFGAVMIVTHVLLIRWIVRYRTGRRWRSV